LAKVLDQVYEGLQAKQDIGVRHWTAQTLVASLQSPAEEDLPIES
jgi:hypothetical protein